MAECLEIGVTLQSLRGLAEVIMGHLLVDLVLVKEGLLDVTEVPATLEVIGVTDRALVAPIAVVFQALQILTVTHPLPSDMLCEGVVTGTEGVLIFPSLQPTVNPLFPVPFVFASFAFVSLSRI